MMEPVIAIAFVLALLVAVLFVLRKAGGLKFTGPQNGKRESQIEIVERVALGPQHGLHLVRAGGRSVLIVTAPSSCQVLDFVSSGERRA
jgi:flagellar biogenesis protein FliO